LGRLRFLDSTRWLQDIYLINGMDWPAIKQRRSTRGLTTTERLSPTSLRRGLDVECNAWSWPSAITTMTVPDIPRHLRRPNRAYSQHRQRHIFDVTLPAASVNAAAFTFRLWSIDRDGLLDFLSATMEVVAGTMCSAARWQAQIYCTPELIAARLLAVSVYRGKWYFRNSPHQGF